MPMSEAILPALKIRSTSSAVSASSNVSGYFRTIRWTMSICFERRRDGGLPLELDRHVDGPELPADAAGSRGAGCPS